MAEYRQPNNFRIIRGVPIELAPDPDGSNVPITEAAWNVSTDYLLDDEVYIGTDLYRSTFGTVGAPNNTDPVAEAAKTDKEAEVSPRGWVRVGKINRWEMFSDVVSRQTIKTSPIEVLLNVPAGTNAVALFNVTGATKATITTYDDTDSPTGTWVEDFVTTAHDAADWSWYLWFNRDESPTSEAVNISLPVTGTAQIRVLIEGPGEIGVGKLVVGALEEVGIALLPWEGGIFSASTVERDVFGSFETVRRASAKYGIYSILVPRYRIDGVQNMLEDALNEPTVFMVDADSPEAILIGILKEVRTSRAEDAPNWGSLKLEVLPLI